MSVLNILRKVKAQIDPFDNGATFNHPQAQPTTATGLPIVQQVQNHPPVAGLSAYKVDPVHTDAQVGQAVGQAAPLGINASLYQTTNALTNQPLHPVLGQLTNEALDSRAHGILKSMPSAANFEGALPPQMINVAWSSHQVPYGTPMPDWYKRQMLGR